MTPVLHYRVALTDSFRYFSIWNYCPHILRVHPAICFPARRRMTRCFFIFTALCLLVVCGCQPKRQDMNYYHPHKPFNQWEIDLDHCRYSVSALQKSDRLQEGSFAEGVEHCMKAKGYVYGYAPYPSPPTADDLYYPPEGTVFTLLDSTWHTTALARKRATYLESTGVWSTMVRSWDSGTAGVWQQVLVGGYDTVYEARRALQRLKRSHGLNNLKIVIR